MTAATLDGYLVGGLFHPEHGVKVAALLGGVAGARNGRHGAAGFFASCRALVLSFKACRKKTHLKEKPSEIAILIGDVELSKRDPGVGFSASGQ